MDFEKTKKKYQEMSTAEFVSFLKSYNKDDFVPEAQNIIGKVVAERQNEMDEYKKTTLSQNTGEDIETNGQHYKLHFTGSAGEYFRIWIVNTFLIVLTFGIYAAWAKVRTRRYFYANTHLGSHSFEYTANPVAILKGNLLVAAGFILYIIVEFYNADYSILTGIAFWFVAPFLIYKSLRFRAHNSTFRNIRFRFLGSLGKCYRIYFLMPLGIPFTLGFIIPYWIFRQKEYVFNNFAYGSTENRFGGKSGFFFRTYGLAALFVILAFVFLVLLAVLLLGLDSQLSNNPNWAGGQGAASFSAFIPLLMMSSIFIFILLFPIARLTNYCWNESRLGKVRFLCTLKARRLIWIRISNILAILFSFGLLAPWAKVRWVCYILENFTVVAEQNLDEFTAISEPDEAALGEAATDIFDIEIGL